MKSQAFSTVHLHNHQLDLFCFSVMLTYVVVFSLLFHGKEKRDVVMYLLVNSISFFECTFHHLHTREC